jgi:hypothetical protein
VSAAVSSLEEAPPERPRVVAAPRVPSSRVKCTWTAKETDTLRMMWGHHDQDEIAKALGRSSRAVFMRARAIGIGGGWPQGFESLEACAARCGFDSKSMKRVLNAHRVPIHRAPSINGRSFHFMVEPHRADEAVVAWCSLETLQQAGRRFGMDGWLLLRHLKAAEARGEIVLPEHHRKRHWRIPRADVDRVMMTWEDGKAAATRIGVSWAGLRNWLVEAGVPRPPGRQWRVRRADVDRIRDAKLAANNRALRPRVTEDIVRDIRARRADGASCRAIAESLGLTHATVSFIARGLTWKHVSPLPKGT